MFISFTLSLVWTGHLYWITNRLFHFLLFVQYVLSILLFRNHSQAFVERNLMQKRVLKLFDPCKGGALKKNIQKFPVKIEISCFFYRVDPKVSWQKRGDLKFVEVWRKQGPNFFFASTTLANVCKWSLIAQ